MTSFKKRGVLVLKGMAMGAADVVPGVSGGTIAFITGIYEELLASIKSVNAEALKLLVKSPKQFWAHINGWFLLPLLTGIGLSILSLAKAITWVLEHYPVLIWAFFFGLVLASIWLVGKTVRKWGGPAFVGIVIGTAVSYFITTITTVADETTHLGYILLCGMVSICAMILPGISGSFILLLMGAYALVIGTIKTVAEAALKFDFGALLDPMKIVGTFAVGAVIGLVAFSRVLTWLFARFHDFTIALLTGFLVGSLNKIWPWKETISTRVRHAGKADERVVPFIQENVWPGSYADINQTEATELQLTVKDPYLLPALGLIVFGVAFILVLDRFGPQDDDAEAA